MTVRWTLGVRSFLYAIISTRRIMAAIAVALALMLAPHALAQDQRAEPEAATGTAEKTVVRALPSRRGMGYGLDRAVIETIRLCEGASVAVPAFFPHPVCRRRFAPKPARSAWRACIVSIRYSA